MVDNHPEFLATRSELVEAAGFKVLAAHTPEEARTLVNNKNNHIDLAVIDLRLHNDDDPDDITGLFLAKELHSLILVIMQTDFASVATVQAALRRNEVGESIADDYVSKNDGSGALIESIIKLLSTRLPAERKTRKSSRIWKIVQKTALSISVIAVIVLIMLGSQSDRNILIAGLILTGLQVVLAVLPYIFTKA